MSFGSGLVVQITVGVDSVFFTNKLYRIPPRRKIDDGSFLWSSQGKQNKTMLDILQSLGYMYIYSGV